MKKFILFAIVLVAASLNSVFAQETAAPRTEFSVSLSEKVVTLKPGETKQITVSILKSKSYANSKTELGLSSTLPTNVNVVFEPAEGMFESSTVSISAAQEAKAGEYNIILKSKVKNTIKGSIVKVVVNSVAADAVSVN
jgi:hypothetical protein